MIQEKCSPYLKYYYRYVVKSYGTFFRKAQRLPWSINRQEKEIKTGAPHRSLELSQVGVTSLSYSSADESSFISFSCTLTFLVVSRPFSGRCCSFLPSIFNLLHYSPFHVFILSLCLCRFDHSSEDNQSLNMYLNTTTSTTHRRVRILKLSQIVIIYVLIPGLYITQWSLTKTAKI